jgi:Mg2+-importing ATPase
VDADRISEAQRWNVDEVRRFMIVFGLISTVFDLLTFVLLLKVFESDETTFQTAWFVVSLLTELAVVLVLRTRGPALRSAPSRLLLWTTVAVGAAALGIPYITPIASSFGFVPLSWQLLLAAVLVVTAYVLTTEAVKLGFFRKSRR